MNERIKELAKQADCTIDGMGYGEGNVEALAKLIVKECANLNFHSTGEVTHEGAGAIGDMIKEHFGVE